MGFVVLMVVLATLGAGQLVNHFEVLGIAETASTRDVKAAYRALAKTGHPDKGGDVEAWLLIGRAYEALRDENGRREFSEELAFFRQHGRLRWQIQYRVIRQHRGVSLAFVATLAILFSIFAQWRYRVWRHGYMQRAARMTKEYRDEVRRRVGLGLDPEVRVEVTGAEPWEWAQAWPAQILLFFWGLGKSVVMGKPKEKVT